MSGLSLKGGTVGNACVGDSATMVQCNGAHEEQNHVELYYDKGLASQATRDNIYDKCGCKSAYNEFPCHVVAASA